MKYLPGKALPGCEERFSGLDYREIAEALGKSVCAGTFNVGLVDDLFPGDPEIETEHYQFWPCSVATSEMIERDEEGLPGWIIRVKGESLPDNLAEILSEFHLRTSLKKTNWPSFPIEIAL